MYNESYISLGGTLVTLPDNTKQFNAMDNIGSVRLTVSMKGQDIATEHFDYKPFGDTLNAEDESRIGYAAQERDEESRYFAMGARQYDPLSGRFLSVDPLYESFPDKTPYHYCNNNPISFKDPSGLSPEGEKGKEDEVQENYEGDEAQSNEILNMLLQFDSDFRNSMKMQNSHDIDGEAMSDASRQRMQDFGGSGGQGFNNTGWDEKYDDRTGDDEDEKNGIQDENSYEEIAGDEEIPEDYEGKKQTGPIDPSYNCINFILNCLFGIPLGTFDDNYQDILNNCEILDFDEPNRPGDILVYWYVEKYEYEGYHEVPWEPSNGSIDNKDWTIRNFYHIGIVTKVDENGNTIEIESKWGQKERWTHHPRDCNYSSAPNMEPLQWLNNIEGGYLIYQRQYFRPKY